MAEVSYGVAAAFFLTLVSLVITNMTVVVLRLLKHPIWADQIARYTYGKTWMFRIGADDPPNSRHQSRTRHKVSG